MAEKAPELDSGAHLSEQVRRIVVEEDGACLGVKVRPRSRCPMRSASRQDADARPAAAAGDDKEPNSVGDGRAAHARWLCVRDTGTSEQIGDPRADHVKACAPREPVVRR